MKKIFLFISLLCFCFKSYSQDFSNSHVKYFKSAGYLEICIDQMKTGLFNEIKDFNFDSSFINDSIKLELLKSSGLSENYIFFRLAIKYPAFGNLMYYTFCFDTDRNMFYKLKGFYTNDFYLLSDNLKRRGIKISSKYFTRKRIAVDGLDFVCLIQQYKSKKINVGIRRELDDTPCLKYNFQPIVVY